MARSCRYAQVNISRAALDDAVGISRVRKQGWFDTYPNAKFGITIDDIKSKFQNPLGKNATADHGASTTWVAKAGGVVVGFAKIDTGLNVNSLRATYVLRSYRGHGIGDRLVAQCLKTLGRDKPIMVRVATYNLRAIQFYRKHGFLRDEKNARKSKYTLPSGRVIPVMEMTLPPLRS